MKIMRALCKACGRRVYRAGKSHDYYTHLNGRGDCELTRVPPGQVVMVEVE